MSLPTGYLLLLKVFNASLKEQSVPLLWKVANDFLPPKYVDLIFCFQSTEAFFS